MLGLRLAMLPDPERFRDFLRRVTMEVSVLLAPLNDYLTLGKSLSAYAIQLAEAGRADEAEHRADELDAQRTRLERALRRIREVAGLSHRINTLDLDQRTKPVWL